MEVEARWPLYTTRDPYALPLQDMHHPPLGRGSILEGPISLSNMANTTKVVEAPPLSRFVLKRLQRMGHGIWKQSPGSGTRHKQRRNRVSGCGGVGVWACGSTGGDRPEVSSQRGTAAREHGCMRSSQTSSTS